MEIQKSSIATQTSMANLKRFALSLAWKSINTLYNAISRYLNKNIKDLESDDASLYTNDPFTRIKPLIYEKTHFNVGVQTILYRGHIRVKVQSLCKSIQIIAENGPHGLWVRYGATMSKSR